MLIWYVYTNIGIDDRNQTALCERLARRAGRLKQAIEDFHRRGVKVFLPTMAWDNGTKGEGVPDWEAVAKLAQAGGRRWCEWRYLQRRAAFVPRGVRRRSDYPLAFQPRVRCRMPMSS